MQAKFNDLCSKIEHVLHKCGPSASFPILWIWTFDQIPCELRSYRETKPVVLLLILIVTGVRIVIIFSTFVSNTQVLHLPPPLFLRKQSPYLPRVFLCCRLHPGCDNQIAHGCQNNKNVTKMCLVSSILFSLPVVIWYPHPGQHWFSLVDYLTVRLI